MIAGLTGSLLSHEALSRAFTPREDLPAAGAIRALHMGVNKELGPAASARVVLDRLAAPLLEQLHFRLVPISDRADPCLYAQLEAGGRAVAILAVGPWGWDPSTMWRDIVRLGIRQMVRWCLCFSGPVMRIVDAARTYSRRYAQFDLEIALQDPAALGTLIHLIHADGFARPPTALDLAVAASEQFRAEVRASLQDGVLDAVESLLSAFASAHRPRRHRLDPEALLDESLVVVYRVLFLLFAEARGLVPRWHRVFRDSYTIESLRGPIERHDRPAGLWESLQAIARLARDGCHAGSLRVTAFNGRLFSPSQAPLAEALALDDGAVRRAMLALTTRSGAGGRRRISYADLGVEQLGGVYERILDFSPAAVEGARQQITLVRAGRRKATGTFYTPRSLTEFVVRRTLAPLVTAAAADRILSLRIVDPAMGSGAFLVAACRYLASAYESALIREGSLSAFDVSEADRATFRRTIAQRCLFGVDINPMAVQLGRLSLWLATLAGDRPLTFLDHHLRTGNSLVGATLEDVARRAPSRGRRRPAASSLPLFELGAMDHAIESVVVSRLSLARDPGETVAQVRNKEQLLLSLQHADGRLARWKAIADLWCATWFRVGGPITPGMFRAVVDRVLERSATLPLHLSAAAIEDARSVAARHRFFHWTLEFPEVFYEQDGHPLNAPGFDAVIGNPPWEVLRGARGASDDSAALTAFTRESGVYKWHGDGHANLYQLFTERALSLAKLGGRLGLVVPWGFAVDHGCAALRRAAFDAAAIDTFVTIENRDGVFPIHRGLKFIVMTATHGTPTAAVPLRMGVRTPDILDGLPDAGDAGSVAVPRSLLPQISGEQHVIPELRSDDDLSLVSRIAYSIPQLTGEGGWNVTFGRELNATEDRAHFIPPSAAPHQCAVVEGKQIAPFAVDIGASRFAMRHADARRLVGTSFTRARLAYRDVASPSNRLTLLAAILPPGSVSTHTVFCVKTETELDVQEFLCGVFNSFVANYLVRLRVNMHVTVAIVERLPVPRPPRDSIAFDAVVRLSRALAKTPGDRASAARLQGIVAALYRCSAPEFEHVLQSFPLVPIAERAAALAQFREARPMTAHVR